MSSSAQARPAACWRAASAPTPRSACSCSRRGRPTGAGRSGCRRRSPTISATRRSIGVTGPSRRRIWTAGGSTGRAARFWAGPPRSTRWSMSAATPATSIAGQSKGPWAGATPTACPTIGGPRPFPSAPMSTGAGRGRSRVTRGTGSNPLFDAWIEAGRQAGYPVTSDMNGFQQEGVGRMDMTIHRGRRWSAAQAYLRPARRRPNLVVVARALATRVLLEGRRAVGVRYVENHGSKTVRAHARGHSRRGCHQLAAASDALGRGPGRRPQEQRRRGLSGPAGRRRQPRGPSRALRPAGLPAAGHPAEGHAAPAHDPDRPALVPVP